MTRSVELLLWLAVCIDLSTLMWLMAHRIARRTAQWSWQ